MPEKKGLAKGKKIGPLSPLMWGLVVAGGVGVYILYKRHEASVAAAGTATSGGTTIPTPTQSGSSGPQTYASLADWEEAAISAMSGAQLSPAAALNGLTDWINGQCVSAAQYSGISNIISTVGLPPGFSTVPVLSVCAGTTATPAPTTQTETTAPAHPAPTQSAPTSPVNPGLAAALQRELQPGEKIVDSAFDPSTSTWLYLTSLGGVYTENTQGAAGGQYLGSYLGLPATGKEGGPRTFTQVQVNPNGGYTLLDTAGERYTFNPKTPAKT